MREKTRDELFDKLAEALGGDYRHRGSLFGDRTEVELRHHDWHLFVDTIQRCEPPVTLTRLRAPYANKDGFLTNAEIQVTIAGVDPQSVKDANLNGGTARSRCTRSTM